MILDVPQIFLGSNKDQRNLSKHKISFAEASTIFGDSLSLTRLDPDHSWFERRYVTLGLSRANRLLVVVHTDHKDVIRIISARRASRREQKHYETEGWIAEMRTEYDFNEGIRGKYAGRFPTDCVLVQLDPDVAQAFPDADAVNKTLRALIPETKRQSPTPEAKG